MSQESPQAEIVLLFEAVLILISPSQRFRPPPADNPILLGWSRVQSALQNPLTMIALMASVDKDTIPRYNVETLRGYEMLSYFIID